MWPDTRLTDLLGIRHPIIQSPMKGASTPALAAAVSAAGGLGSLALANLSPEATAAALHDFHSRSNHPVNANFFASPAADGTPGEVLRARLKPHYAALGLGDPPDTLSPAAAPFTPDTLEALLTAPPRLVSFHFGLPEFDVITPLHDAGCIVICSATTAAEARALEAAGVDAIIAQGWEAGGHRGAFTVEPEDAGVGLFALLPQIADAVRVPVIAAGGIADGRGIAAALMLGASGVQIGTAFLSTPEADIPALHRERVRDAADSSTRLTLAHSGRPARGHRTAYTLSMAGAEPAPFPQMYQLSDPLRATGNPEYSFHLYGQAAALNREMAAADLVRTLAREALDRLGGKTGIPHD